MHVAFDPRIDDISSLDDDELLRRVRAGHIGAFDVLYRRHVSWARRTARWHLGSMDAADDVVSDAFMATLQALHHGRGPTEGFRTYLRACIRNRCASQRKHDGRSTVEWVDGSDYDRSTGPATDRMVRTASVATAFRSLNPRWQQVLWLTAVDGLDPAEAAERMGMCTNAMNALTHRAREALAMAYVDAHVSAAAPTCSQIATKFARYVRGHASERDIEKVETHLATCLPCAHAVVELRNLNESLRTMPFAPACPPVAAAAVVGLSWAGKLALVAGVVASASAMIADQPITFASRPSTPTQVVSRDRPDEPMTRSAGAPGHRTVPAIDDGTAVSSGGDASPTAAVETSEAGRDDIVPIPSRASDVADDGGGDATSGAPSIVSVPSTVPSVTGTGGPAADPVTVPVADVVTNVLGSGLTIPTVSAVVTVDGSALGASLDVDLDVAGIDLGIGTTVSIAPSTVDVTASLPGVTLDVPVTVPVVTLPSVALPSLPPLLPPTPVASPLPHLGP